MRILTFRDSGWNENLITHLEMHGCAGLELHWRRGEDCFLDSEGIEKSIDFMTNLGYERKWGMLAHNAVQPIIRIVHHRGIFKHAGIGFDYLKKDASIEWSVEYEEGLRFFGVVRHEALSGGGVSLFKSEMNSCWLVLGSNDYHVADFKSWLPCGWGAPQFLPHGNLLDVLRAKGLILLKYFESNPDSIVCIIVGTAKEIGEICIQ